MIAFDTNLLVRLVVTDEPSQAAIVRNLISQHTVFVSRTVLLETEWVLRTVYKHKRPEILAFFRALIEVDNTEIENVEAVSQALDFYALGADFADSLHLAVCGSAVMHAFDKSFCKAARVAGISPEINIIQAN